MLVSNYSAKFYRDKIKVVASKIDIEMFDSHEVDKTKKQISNSRLNHLSCVANFKEKFAYNFNKIDNLLFCTLTIATYDNPNISDTTDPVMVIKGGEPFEIEKQKFSNAGNYDWASKQFRLFILRLKRKFKLGDDFKYGCVAELQDDKWVLCKDKSCKLDHKLTRHGKKHFKTGRKVWHFHFVASQFLPKHKDCPINRSYSGKTVGCLKCNWKLAKVWKIGYCQKKEAKIKNGNHFATYMSKYMSKAFQILGSNKKAYRFSRSCKNVPVEKLRLISIPNNRYIDENGNVVLTNNTVINFNQELFANCNRFEIKEVEIKSSVPNECYYDNSLCNHSTKYGCFYKKVKSIIFWFTDYKSMNWIKEQFAYFKSDSWKRQLLVEFREYFNFYLDKQYSILKDVQRKENESIFSLSKLKERYWNLGTQILQKN